jgi:hypothetical protein
MEVLVKTFVAAEFRTELIDNLTDAGRHIEDVQCRIWADSSQQN